MEWAQTISVIATVISAAVYIHQDVKRQGERTDHFYEIIIDLIKEGKK